MAATPDYSAVADQSAAVKKMAEPWAMIQALIDGTGAMRAAGKAFLPQFPQESDDAYKIRLSQAVLFAAFSNTVDVLAAKPMSREMSISGVPPQIEALFDDIDGQDSTLASFTMQRLREALQYGIGGILVDAPPNPGARTVAEEKAAGIRPYFCAYSAPSILGWRVEKVTRNPNAADAYKDQDKIGLKLTQLRLLENITEPDGAFGEKQIQQVRVLYPGKWQIYRQIDDQTLGKKVWTLFQEGVTTLSYIPFFFFYGYKLGFGIGKSPLLDLAYANVEHWQSSSDQQNILHVARVPILFGKGMPEDTNVVVGANSITLVSDENADMKFVEHTGAAIDAGRQSILDIEDRMRQLGAELLVQQNLNVTATQTISEGEASKSKLQQIVENFEETLEKAIDCLGDWMKVPCNAEVDLFKDFGAASLTDSSAKTLMDAEGAGYVSKETVFDGLKRRDIIPAGTKWEDEQAKIKAEAAANPKPPPPPAPVPPGAMPPPGAPMPAPAPTPPPAG